MTVNVNRNEDPFAEPHIAARLAALEAAPGGSGDPLVIAAAILLTGTAAGRPAASAANANFYYYATDTNGGTLYQSNGSAWNQLTRGLTQAPTGGAGGDLSGSYPNPAVAAGAITDSKVAAANKDGTAGTASMRTLGAGAAQAAAGNDSRLSDARVPTSHDDAKHSDGPNEKTSRKDAASGYAGLDASTLLAAAEMGTGTGTAAKALFGNRTWVTHDNTGDPHSQYALDTDLALYLPKSLGTTKGDILVFDGTNWVRLGVGTNTQVVTADSAQTSGVKWAGVTPSGIGASANPHGAADHTDITRRLWYPSARFFDLDGATNTTAGTVPDGTRVQAFADAATQGSFGTLQAPHDAVAGQPLNIILDWLPGSTDATAHTVRWSVNAKVLVAGTDGTAAGTTTAFTGSSAARTANLMVIEASTQVLASVNADDLIRISIRRLGADAADTYVGAVNFVGLWLEYTATQ